MQNRVLSFLTAFAMLAGVIGAWATPAGADGQLLGEDVFETEKVRAQLLGETLTIVPGQPFEVALHLQIQDHWHTYWKFSGDSGAATTINWTLPEGFTASEIKWAAPSRIPLGPLMNFGYEGEAVHFVTITPPEDLVEKLAPGAAVPLLATSEWLVCDDEMCIPEFGTFRLLMKTVQDGASARPNPVWGLMTGDAARSLAKPAPFDVAYALKGERLQLQLGSSAKLPAGAEIAFFPYEDGIVSHAAPQTRARAGDTTILEAPASYRFEDGTFGPPLRGLLVFDTADGLLSFDFSAERAAPIETLAAQSEISGTAGPPAPSPRAQDAAPAGGGGGGLLLAIAGAFVGGLILNLMPCVFPVLSMKALGFAKRAHVDPGALRRHGWVFTAGVLSSFLVVAAILIALRGGGASVGWGYQLQSPLVVLLLAYLMFAIGLSLSGFLTLGASLAGLGSGLAGREGLAGAFFTGVLATLVASPCTAPFMGAALTYALMQPGYAGLAVFVSLGLGLAAPYLLLAHVPAALKWLPRPGPWMERLKELLAFPMYATAAWLLWVMAQQTGPNGLFGALTGFVLIGFAVWVFRTASDGSGRAAETVIARSASALALVLALVIGVFVSKASAPVALASDPEAIWQPFSPDRLEAARRAERPVFVDFTAAWCVTCKVNELGALSSGRVRAAFESRGVVALRGDWTNRDPVITSVLAQYDRVGVPLYLYFPAGAREPIILPQILSETVILKALGRDG